MAPPGTMIFLKRGRRWSKASPTLALERGNGNNQVLSTHKWYDIAALNILAKASHHAAVHFYPIPGSTHFSGLQPVSRLIAQKILPATGPALNLAFTAQEIVAAKGNAP